MSERLALSLRSDGHTVFFDRSDIEAGEEYDSKIRRAIDACDLFVFLISPESVAPDSYALAELGIAAKRWSHPKGYVLPLVVKPVEIGSIPPYLRAVSVFDPQGDFVAESSAAIARIANKTRRRRHPAVAVALVLAAVAAWLGYQRFEQNRKTREEVARVIAAANTSLEAGGYSDAFQALTEAAARFPDVADLKKTQEHAAMLWLRNIRVRVGEQTFTDVVGKVRPILSSAASAATGQEAGDLTAHLGWGEYLRVRDGRADADPVIYFKKATEADPPNPYAHVMWGFWILFRNGALTEAQPHFEVAATSGRDRAWVRNLQLAALLLRNVPANEREAIRAANAMRLEQVPVQQPDRLWSLYEYALLRRVNTEDFLQIIPAADHLTTFRWLFPKSPESESKNALYRFLTGRLEEAAGNRDSAVSSYQWVANHFRANGDTGPLLDRALEGLRRLER